MRVSRKIVRMRKIGWSFPIFDPPRRRLVSYRSAQKHLAPRAGACHHRHRIMTRLPPLSRSEEHTSELQSLMRISYAVFCLKKKNNKNRSPRMKTHTRYTPMTTHY